VIHEAVAGHSTKPITSGYGRWNVAEDFKYLFGESEKRAGGEIGATNGSELVSDPFHRPPDLAAK
jgi:hypothetical protein